MESTYVKIIVIITLLFVVCFVFFCIAINFLEDSLELKNKVIEDYKDLVTELTQEVEEKHTDYLISEKKNVELVSRLKNLNICYLTEDEIYLLAQCVEAEAGEHNFMSQRYVTQVILNRLNSKKFPNSMRDVIYQENNGVPQFSVAFNGMMDREVLPSTLNNVYSVLLHGSDLPEYVHYFFSSEVTGNWVNTLNIHKTVEGTTFSYSEVDFNE